MIYWEVSKNPEHYKFVTEKEYLDLLIYSSLFIKEQHRKDHLCSLEEIRIK